MLDELKAVFESSTIKPTYDYVHVILALFIFGEHQKGIGRYRLEKELSIGSGTAKSLVKRLKKDIEFITILSNDNKRTGHILTENGENYLSRIKQKIPFIEEGDLSIVKNIIIESQNVNPYVCIVKNAAKSLTNGLDQRDAAIKVGGTGASCLIYDGTNLTFPSLSMSKPDEEYMKVDEEVQEYFEEKVKTLNSSLEKNDIIIIGQGNDSKKARLSALNAALTLIS